MGEHTAISWTDGGHTFNPWIGCARVSPGCQHCYAEALSKRWGHARWGKDAPRHITSDVYWRQPLKWNRAAAAAGRRALVFCASQADVFEDRPDLVEPRVRLWELIESTPHLVWLLLTKRPENVARMVPGWEHDGWPANVWLGTTVEDQQRAIDRVPILIGLGAQVRFLSCEPLLERVDLTPWLGWPTTTEERLRQVYGGGSDWLDLDRLLQPIGWVICGGESGPGHRNLDLDAARSLRDQCTAAGVPYFFKQVGGHYATAGGDLLDGEVLKAWPAGYEPTGTAVTITTGGGQRA